MKDTCKEILKKCGWERCIVAAFLLLVMVVGSVSLIVLPKAERSEDENRVLQSPPEFSAENLLDGSFMDDTENYVADHFPARREFIALHTQLMLASGKRDVGANYSQVPAEGGVYFGKDGHLYEVLLAPDHTDTFQNNIQALTSFSANAGGLPLTILAVPSGAQEQPENLPAFAPSHDQREELEAIQSLADGNTQVLDVFDALSLENGDYYYKTDHHWNLEGAFVGYTEMAKAMGFTPLSRDQYEFDKVSDSFYGTLYSRAIYWQQQPDAFYLPRFLGEDTLTQVVGEKEQESLYHAEYLEQKDKYSTFLGGNHPVDVIRNSAVEDGKLLLVKDSYANCLAPFLAQHFAEIHVVDLRYFNMDIYQYIEEKGIDQLAAVYSIKQLCDVNVASKLLR